MEKVPVENIYSMFPKISKDVIQIIYEQDKENILDILLEISKSCDIDNKNKDCNIQNEDSIDTNNNEEPDHINDNEESGNFQNNSKINKLFNYFSKKSKYKYEKL
jgi:hypothetical protein